MGTARHRRSARAGCAPMRSPGRPTAGRREHRQRFWEGIRRGLSSEDAALAAGVSQPVGGRWFRESGGMPPFSLAPLPGAFCRSPSERRSPSGARSALGFVRSPGESVDPHRRFRGSCGATPRPVAADSSTGRRRPSGTLTGRRGAKKVAKLAANGKLRGYVQDRLAGMIAALDGARLQGPKARWSGRRHGRRQDRVATTP
jgi:hypothetical protein